MKEKSDERNISRREVLRLAGASVATALVGCTPDQRESIDTLETAARNGAPATAPTCVVRPEQMEGPYFVDRVLHRSDIRTDPGDGAARPGAPLRLFFNVSRVDRDTCEPLADALVDVWQCDAVGVYSAFRDMNGLFDTREQRFLRGYQVTDAEGRAEFMTIYPGWYPGRAVHIHFKIRTDPSSDRGHEFTSQLYFDDELNERMHTREPYASHGPPPAKNADDDIFRRGGDELMLDLVEEEEGYTGTFAIGLRI